MAKSRHPDKILSRVADLFSGAEIIKGLKNGIANRGA